MEVCLTVFNTILSVKFAPAVLEPEDIIPTVPISR